MMHMAHGWPSPCFDSFPPFKPAATSICERGACAQMGVSVLHRAPHSATPMTPEHAAQAGMRGGQTIHAHFQLVDGAHGSSRACPQFWCQSRKSTCTEAIDSSYPDGGLSANVFSAPWAPAFPLNPGLVWDSGCCPTNGRTVPEISRLSRLF